MKKLVVLSLCFVGLTACSEEQKPQPVPVVSQSELTKICDSLMFNGKTKVKIKLENVKVEGQSMDVDAECVISLEKE